MGLDLSWFTLSAILVYTSPVKRHFDTIDHWIPHATGTFLIALGIRLTLAETTE